MMWRWEGNGTISGGGAWVSRGSLQTCVNALLDIGSGGVLAEIPVISGLVLGTSSFATRFGL
jgi:hypothetical protein